MEAGSHDWVFYDGTCGLCHRAVRFIVLRDRRAQFLYAPLQGARHRELGGAGEAGTVVVLTRRGETLVRSDATIYILRQLGGGWRALAAALAVMPRGLRDAAYRFVAVVRGRLFRAPRTVCPRLPAYLASRFFP